MVSVTIEWDGIETKLRRIDNVIIISELISILYSIFTKSSEKYVYTVADLARERP